MKWFDVKLATLQKMFAADGELIPQDGSVDDYLAGMPYAANEALQMLSTAGKYVIKNYVIEHEYSDNVEDCRYDMGDLVDDYFQLSEVYIENEDGYRKFTEYTREGEKKIVLYKAPRGKYTVYYRAYPAPVTIETDDEYDLPLAPEVATLLPLYMASQLYKDDDIAIATTYRNEFEVAFERLVDSSRGTGKEEWISESGWI